MATARKTASGMWRIRCLSHTDSDKKKHYVSFTEPTKALAEQKAAQFNHRKKRMKRHDLSISEAVAQYIDGLPDDTSPSTLRGYRAIQKRIDADAISSIRINSLCNDDLKGFIKIMQRRGLSAKTIRSTYSLLMSSITPFCDIRFDVKLPKIHRPPKDAPSDSSIVQLIDAASPRLKRAICLAAFGSLRRGEAAALKFADVDPDHNTVTVHADIVMDPSGKWVFKDHPKTDNSFRTVELPAEIIAELGTGDPDAYVVGLTPGSISDRFYELKKRLGLSIRYHDLRGYCASIMAALGISDIYAQRRGGWSSTGVLKDAYQNVIREHDRQFTAQLNNYFSEMLKKDDSKDDPPF